MWLILILTIGQAVSSTLAWIGFYAGVRTLPGARARQSRWIIGSAVVTAAWLVGVFLLGAADVFRNGALPPRIPIALARRCSRTTAPRSPNRACFARLARLCYRPVVTIFG